MLKNIMWVACCHKSHSDPNDDVILDDNDRSVPIVTRSVTRTEHQLYEDKQDVSHFTSLELPNYLASNVFSVSLL